MRAVALIGWMVAVVSLACGLIVGMPDWVWALAVFGFVGNAFWLAVYLRADIRH